jgi:hypothetical protein
MERRTLLTTIYVDMNASGGTHDGTAWTSAFTDLQQALATATPRDEIHIADGTYTPSATGDRTASFQLRNEVSLLGGFAGDGASNPDSRDATVFRTYLSGQISSSKDPTTQSAVVVSGSGTAASALLDGCTLTGGGTGMVNLSGSPTVRNCIFTGLLGRGMRNEAASPFITDCSFVKGENSQGDGIDNLR